MYLYKVCENEMLTRIPVDTLANCIKDNSISEKKYYMLFIKHIAWYRQDSKFLLYLNSIEQV